MTAAASAPATTHDWYRRWEAQQAAYVFEREERFTAMLDAVEGTVGPEFVAIDIGCGPGAIARRIADRFPLARVIAVDLDPVLLAIARTTHGDAGGRIRWLNASLRDGAWPSALPLAELGVGHVDAALSSTAIHWLHSGEIVDLYRQLARLVRPGGVVVNGDHMQYSPALPTLRRLAGEWRARQLEAGRATGRDTWEQWWLGVRADPQFAQLLEERDRLFAWRPGDREAAIGSSRAAGAEVVHTGVDVHLAALREAGFSEVDTVWQRLDNRVILAVR